MLRFKIELGLIKFAQKILMMFPEEKRYKFAEGLGRFAYKFIKKRREITLKQIRNAFPTYSNERVEEIAIKSYETMLKTFTMSLWVPDIIHDDNKVAYENFELFEEIHNRGKGVIFITLHMGAFEASLKLAKEYELYDVIKPQKNILLDKYMNENRRRTGVNLIYKGNSAMRELVKAIRNKGIVALFSDHYDEGSEVKFFGQDTFASNGAVSMSLKYDVPIIIAYNRFDENNKSILKFDREFILETSGDRKKDIDINTQRMIDIFEEIISEYPEQWMWFHRRWRS